MVDIYILLNFQQKCTLSVPLRPKINAFLTFKFCPIKSVYIGMVHLVIVDLFTFSFRSAIITWWNSLIGVNMWLSRYIDLLKESRIPRSAFILKQREHTCNKDTSWVHLFWNIGSILVTRIQADWSTGPQQDHFLKRVPSTNTEDVLSTASRPSFQAVQVRNLVSYQGNLKSRRNKRALTISDI